MSYVWYSNSGNEIRPFRSGHEHLERTGLIHMNGRVYDPAIGRFLSPDPIVADASFSQSWNVVSEKNLLVEIWVNDDNEPDSIQVRTATR